MIVHPFLLILYTLWETQALFIRGLHLIREKERENRSFYQDRMNKKCTKPSGFQIRDSFKSVSPPLKNMSLSVGIKWNSQIDMFETNVPNHQPAIYHIHKGIMTTSWYSPDFHCIPWFSYGFPMMSYVTKQLWLLWFLRPLWSKPRGEASSDPQRPSGAISPIWANGSGSPPGSPPSSSNVRTGMKRWELEWWMDK